MCCGIPGPASAADPQLPDQLTVGIVLPLTGDFTYLGEAVRKGVEPQPNTSRTLWKAGLQLLTGVVVEQSLAVDNIFVFVVVVTFFAIPAKYQHRVLFYGIIGALIFRAVFIALGSVLMQYKWIVILFGVFLILTGIKMFFAPRKNIDPSKNIVIRTLKRFVPVTSALEGQKFFVHKDGVRYLTPLFLALVFIELSDIIFAVDSVISEVTETNLGSRHQARRQGTNQPPPHQ